MTKTQIFFFPPPKSEYFFQQHCESEYLFRKKTYPPPPFKLNGRSLTFQAIMFFSEKFLNMNSFETDILLNFNLNKQRSM